MNLDALLARFGGADEDGDGWVAVCPSHADSKPSLRISVGEKGVLVKCRARCRTEEVLSAVGLHFSDLFDVDTTGTERRAVSTSAPASPADVAALQARLDAYVQEVTDSPTVDHPAHVYAAERFGLTWDDFLRLGLGYATDLGGGPRLVVPFRDARGIARGFQARALDRDAAVRWLGPKSPDGRSWAKTGFLHGAGGWAEWLLVTEGPSDGLTACGAGFDAVFVRGAALAGNPEVVASIKEAAGDRAVVVFGDADAAGDTFARTLVGALSAAGVAVVVSARPGAADLTDWRAADPAAFQDALVTTVQTALAGDVSAITARLDAYTDSDLTDLGMAKRLRSRIVASESDVRFAPELGFLLLDGGVWRPDGLDKVRTTAQESAAALWAEAESMEEDVLALDPSSAKGKRERKRLARLRQFAKHANSTRGIDSMIREVSALSGVATDVASFDARPDLLAVRNGVVNLKTGALLAHDPAFLLTRRIDLDYAPDAQAPRWEAFLEEVFPSYPAMPAYVRRLVGYGITGSTAEQCFAVLWGTGANGKSVFTDTLTEVFREITVTTPFSTFEQKPSGGIPNDLAALKGSRLVMAAEGEQGRPMAEAVLKRVTGRDLISARFMRKEFFEFRPTFLLLLATNFKPQFRGQDEGLWRRVKLLPWERYFRPEERDHRLGAALMAEAPGILAWAVRGAREWYAGGLQDPPVVVSSTREYRETSDALAGFLGSSSSAESFLSTTGYSVTGDPDDVVLGRTLWEAYGTWADEEALPQRERWTRRTFFAALEERGLEKRKRAQGVAFCGVRRVRVTDAVPDHDEPERADGRPLASSSPVTDLPTSGPSLDDAF